VIVHNNMADLKASIFYQELEEFVHCMKTSVGCPKPPFFFTVQLKNKSQSISINVDPKLKSMCLVNTRANHENVTTIVITHDEELLMPSLMEVYKCLCLIINNVI
jgi:arginine/ornithine N-succinyltransferase beta subunit